MDKLKGKKTYIVVIGVLATGLVHAGVPEGAFDLSLFWDYLLGGAALAALRNGIG